MKLKPHKFAEFLPPMSEAEYQAMKDDIAANGQREPIILLDGKILDGRHRNRACVELGVEPKTKEYPPAWGEPIFYVHSKALHRNCNDSQKACAAVQFLPEFEKHAKRRMLSGGSEPVPQGQIGKARDQAGSILGVSGRYVSEAKAILEADAKLFREVFEGRLPITRAKRLVLRTARTRQAKAAAKSGRIIDPAQCSIITGDCATEMEKLPRGKFRLIFADPPYNLGFKYFDDPTKDQLNDADYFKRTKDWVRGCRDLLTPDGTLCWMIPEEHVAMVGLLLEREGLFCRRLIVWHESFGQAGHNNFGRTCRFIWYATKHKTNFVFDAAAVLVESKRASQYNDARAMPGGKTPDALWDFSRVAGTFSERIPDEGIPTQLPVELVKRAVRCFTEPGDAILDPFGGTGTTARAALSCGRTCVTIERSKKYAAIIKRELMRMNTAGAEGK